jgi:primosomal protein N' (replication factor Y)
VVDFCRWAAWRWAGRLTVMLRLASPDHVVKKSPPVRVRPAPTERADELAAELLAQGPGPRVLQVSPTADPLGIALAAAATGQALVVVPGVVAGGTLARRLRRAGANVAEWPDGWAAAAGARTQDQSSPANNGRGMEVTKGENIFGIEEDFRRPRRRAQTLCFRRL